MNCNYIIKTPDGGEIIIPAKFGLIEPDQSITDGIEALKKLTKDNDARAEKLFSLTSSIQKVSPQQITREMITNIIEENIDNLDNVVPTINKLINGLGDYVDLKSAIYSYIKSGKNNLSKLKTALKKSYIPEYFSGLSMEGVLGVTTLKEQLDRVEGNSYENIEFGFPNIIPEKLGVFIKGFINSQHEELKKIFKAKTLLGTKSSLGTRAFNVEGFTFFNQNDDLSLFQGLFKRAASNVDKKDLFEIIKKHNELNPELSIKIDDFENFDVFKFFNGSIGKDGKLTLGVFDIIFDKSDNQKIKGLIDNIINLVTNYISPENTKLNKSAKVLFWELNPETYGSNALEKELAQETFIANELKIELSYKNKVKADFLEKISNSKDKYFAEAESFITDLWDNSKRNITINQDIVQFPVDKNINPYCVVTAMFPRPKGVMMYGVYKNQFGDVERLQHYFVEGEKITYRKREESPDQYIAEEQVVPVIKEQYYTGDITPDENTIFVFGSNPVGINGNPTKGTGGAALVASKNFGVKQGEKMDNKLSDSGNAYGLTTVTYPGKKRSITPDQITDGIVKLYETAIQNPDKQFKIAYRNTTDESLNGYTGLEMIDMFNNAGTIPSNIIFSKEWFDTGKLNLNQELAQVPITETQVALPEPYITENKNVAFVDATEMSSSLKKSLLSKGDTINGKYLVIGVQPGSVTIKDKSNNRISTVSYKRIKSILSAKAKQSVDLSTKINFRDYSPISDISTISKGDFYRDEEVNFFKQVLFEDESNVYSFIPGKEAGTLIIKPYPKEKIKVAYAYTFGSTNIDELDKVSKQFKMIGKRGATMSSFTNIGDAKENDYFAYTNSKGSIEIGKVINTKNNKGIVYNPNGKKFETIDYSAVKDITFLTDRDISSNYSMTIARVNDWNIQALDEISASKSPAYKEARYVIPITANPKDLILLPSNYATVGQYIDMNTPIEASQKDATEDILRLIQERGMDTTGLKLYLKTEDAAGKSNSYERNLYSLHRITRFGDLDLETKKNLNIIQPGVYFSLYREGDIDSNIYRVMEVSNDIVTAHLNKFSNGKLITTERRFKVSELLAQKVIGEDKNPVNSIAKLYLQYGNKKFNIVTKTIKDKLNTQPNQRSVNTIMSKMSEVFSSLGIGVKRVNANEGNFEHGQRAKIETSVDESGKTSVNILLNDNAGLDNEGLAGAAVHETLHVYLTLLRYKNPELYDLCINSVFTDENIKYLEDSLEELDFENMDVTTKEELFVKLVSEKTKANEDIISNNIEEFIGPLVTAIQELNPEADIDYRGAVSSPLTELNKPLREIVKGVSVTNSHPMFNLSAITTEPAMREWMQQMKITLKC